MFEEVLDLIAGVKIDKAFTKEGCPLAGGGKYTRGDEKMEFPGDFRLDRARQV